MKVSQMILDFAGDFIDMGETIEQKRSHLNAACSAWNIAILPKHERTKDLKKYLNAYIDANPIEDDISHFRHDMELLIKEKIRMFPNIKKPIVNAQILQEGDQYKILAASLRNE